MMIKIFIHIFLIMPLLTTSLYARVKETMDAPNPYLNARLREIEDRLDVLSGDIVYNVKRYGAIGDGKNNDTDAISDAIAASITAGAKTYFPTGTYLVTDWEETFSGAAFLFGDGASSIIKGGKAITFQSNLEVRDLQFQKWDETSWGNNSNESSVFWLTSDDNTTEYYRFDNVTFTDGGSAIRANVQTDDLAELIVRNCHFFGVSWYCIYVNNKIKYVDISGNEFEAIGSYSTELEHLGNGIYVGHNDYITDTRFVHIRHNKFLDLKGIPDNDMHAILVYCYMAVIDSNTINTVHSTGEDAEAIYVKGKSVVITNNVVIGGQGDNSDGSIVIKGGDSSLRNIINGNTILGGDIYANSGCIISNNHITGGKITLNQSDSQDTFIVTSNYLDDSYMVFENLENSIISNNVIEANGDNTITFNPGSGTIAENVIVIGNIITQADASKYCIRVSSTTSNVQIIRNYFSAEGTVFQNPELIDVIEDNIGYP